MNIVFCFAGFLPEPIQIIVPVLRLSIWNPLVQLGILYTRQCQLFTNYVNQHRLNIPSQVYTGCAASLVYNLQVIQFR
ncbi:Uncharacterised protein [Klebsiella oxytoca]|nr:Uncharacterised protein [Klebsiella oxytoca]